jgi:hypothetical protein
VAARETNVSETLITITAELLLKIKTALLLLSVQVIGYVLTSLNPEESTT